MFTFFWLILKEDTETFTETVMPDALAISLILALSSIVAYLVLMVVIGLPLFAIVKKFTDFSWVYAIFMVLVFGIIMNYLCIIFLESSEDFQLHLFLILNVIFSAIFAPIHYWFKKRQKPYLKNVDEVFN
ncbi:hypothetical protein N5853_14480 (plasmid) [Bartonella sp. HY329]|uniref:hypothetical protein n=1 Tax=unclassified Bartonella TaxID=2645622 RepID=UPI0021C67919|nr:MULTISPECIES: hypothetical protein [unclassified Bartonella]UXM96523.1 hypothetical protein N5853_14480 [Bartonella sp. HY329]UXN10846.1 hypothetical protein N5852_14485 [Bartonella sp. HY328]